MTDPASCQHRDFIAEARVVRLEDVGEFCCELHVRCAECGTPFRFVGVSAGFSGSRPMASVDGLELRAPIAPGPILPGGRALFEVSGRGGRH